MIKWLKVNRTSLLVGVVVALSAAGAAVAVGTLTKSQPVPPVLPPRAEKPPLSPPVVELSKFASGFTKPVVITATPTVSDKRVFVVEQAGVIKIIQADGTVSAQAFLDISSKVLNGGEMGLLGLAFSPNYSRDGNFFINYTDRSQNTIVARYHAPSPGSTDPASEEVLLKIAQPYTNHNGGALLFGPDGYLYAALGDGGSGGDPHGYGQNLNSLLGKLLRLDVSQLPYKSPSSNPYANQPGKRPEIWDYGLRNPWRLSFDRKTDALYIADVGQGDIEEINREQSGSKGGVNYGWRCFEGSKDFNLSGCASRDNYSFPILEYDHSEDRCSVTGGYVYRGKKYPALDGKYFYADFCGGQLYSAEIKDARWQAELIVRSPYRISTFGEDSGGELYLADYTTGDIFQIRDTAN